ncbi:MAG TPA: hypothetical protein VK879_12615 [Candidatus Sulfomarinibacteraceae bacterium]|nr:hypothetical protein [Candidatus Sulfomarinibacteraceae bacterium]
MGIDELQTFAGVVSTAIFAGSNLPMLIKAAKTRDLSSYSFTYLVASNVGNMVHWVYIAQLPTGPIWFLHLFYTVTMLLMLVWYLRFERREC